MKKTYKDSSAKEIIDKLIEYNKWRRDEEEMEQPDPTEIGFIIERAISLLKILAKMKMLQFPDDMSYEDIINDIKLTHPDSWEDIIIVIHNELIPAKELELLSKLNKDELFNHIHKTLIKK